MVEVIISNSVPTEDFWRVALTNNGVTGDSWFGPGYFSSVYTVFQV